MAQKKKKFKIVDQDDDEWGPHESVKECVDELVVELSASGEDFTDFRYSVFENVGDFSISISSKPSVKIKKLS